MKVRIRFKKQIHSIVIYLTFTLLIVRAVAGIRGMPQYSSVRYVFTLGGVHKLRSQDEVGRWSKNVQKCPLFVNVYTVENVVGGQKKPKSCQRSL
jgi:hypothetical protein